MKKSFDILAQMSHPRLRRTHYKRAPLFVYGWCVGNINFGDQEHPMNMFLPRTRPYALAATCALAAALSSQSVQAAQPSIALILGVKGSPFDDALACGDRTPKPIRYLTPERCGVRR